MLYKPFQIVLVSAINATPPTLWERLFVFAVFPAIICWMWTACEPNRLPEWQDVLDIFNFFNKNRIIAALVFWPVQKAVVNYFVKMLAIPHNKVILLHIFLLVLAANFSYWYRQSPPFSRVLVFIIVSIVVLVQGAVYASGG
ncbi:uncharacterized protein DS421_18g603630 [Arachis hypogaea]|nr:uncharacterized protein DS421_18g603630 [Arachis hypogaea]